MGNQLIRSMGCGVRQRGGHLIAADGRRCVGYTGAQPQHRGVNCTPAASAPMIYIPSARRLK